MKKLAITPIAHRGLHESGVPENSLAAFRAAAEAGYCIETDVRFSKDGTLVVFHDNDLSRMTGDPRRVEELTCRELKELRLGGTDERIPLLSELFEAADGVPLLVEIKSMPFAKGKEVASALAPLLDAYRGEYAVQSFDPFYVKAYKSLRPAIFCGLLAKARYDDHDVAPPFRAFKKRRLENMTFCRNPDFLSFLFSDFPTPRTEKFRGTKFAWTIRSPEEEAIARKYADNIIFENYRPKL